MYQGEFIDDTIEMNLDFSIYEKAKHTLIAMMGLKPQSDSDEREAIISVLNNNHNIENYIQEHLEIEETYYIVEKTFFDAWSMNVEFTDDKNYVIKKEKMQIMDNAEMLIEPMHDKRMKAA